MKYYAVRKGRQMGIFTTWEECQNQIFGYKGAQFKSFSTEQEALEYLGLTYGNKKNIKKEEEEEESSGPFNPGPPSNMFQVWTDGSSVAQKAGFGFILLKNDEVIEHGYGRVVGRQTNQRAELSAIYYGLLKAIDWKWSSFDLVTDSAYSLKCLSLWAPFWIKNGWKTTTGQPVENQDLIKPCLSLLKKLNVQFIHVLAHKGIHWNEEADKLADLGRELD